MAGWIFVNPDGSAPDFTEYVGNLDGLIGAWESERLFVAATHEYVIDANWKTITENYHECYHCPSIHPELCVVTPPTPARTSRTTGCGSVAPWC